MNIAVVGTGYVGLVSGACFSEMGINVTCVDIDKNKIESLRKGIVPIYEPNLTEMVIKNHRAGRLRFATDLLECLHDVEVVFCAVGTPPDEDGAADLQYVLDVARIVGQNIDKYTLFVTKSTVPVGTSERVKDVIEKEIARRGLSVEFDVASNPEFLKEGAAIKDFMSPDRIVVGVETSRARQIMDRLYKPFTLNRYRMIYTDIPSAEMIKYAANAMLATRISFMNEIANLCDLVGADVNMVRQGIGADSRIGNKFLYPGCGYGGSCFPKDVKELIAVGRRNNIDMRIAQAVEAVNEEQKHVLVQQIIKQYGENLNGKTFALWGLAFKPQTDDMREAPSIVIINELVKRGAHIRAYDPEAYQTAKHYLSHIAPDALTYEKDMWAPLSAADALILVTEWKQFRQPDFEKIKQLLKAPVIFDGRNQYSITLMKELGINYSCIGRNV